MTRSGLLLAIALLLAGCAGVRMPSVFDSDPEERQVIQLINYAQRVARMTDQEQRVEYGASNRAFATDKDTMSRMRLALLLATPGASVYDATRAVLLLEPMAAPGDAASPMRALARLLYVHVNAQLNERNELAREQHERAREHKRANQMREQIESRKDAERSIREQLEAQKEVEHTLRKQLDALKEVERTIMQRKQESLPRRR